MDILWSNGFWSFVFLTLLLGGGAAWMSGRAIAHSWKSLPLLAFYCLLLACAVRFLHYALHESTLLSPGMLLIDFVVMLVAGFSGFRVARVSQMVTQYRWLYERNLLFWWRERTAPAPRRR